MEQRDPFGSGLKNRFRQRARAVAKTRRIKDRERPALVDVLTRAVAIWLALLVAGVCVQKAATIDMHQAVAHLSAAHPAAFTTGG